MNTTSLRKNANHNQSQGEPSHHAKTTESLAIDSIAASIAKTSPRILLTATLRWPIAARIAIALSDLGCSVVALCPRQHSVGTVRAIEQTYPYSSLRPLVSLQAAIIAASPDLIIPCDDVAAIHLQRLFNRLNQSGAQRAAPGSSALHAVIARSLGTPEACLFATLRGRIMAEVETLGVRIPATQQVNTLEDLDAWCDAHPFPAVVKVDSTWGGQGVVIVSNRKEAQRAFSKFIAGPSFLSVTARVLLDRDPTPLRKWLIGTPRTVTLQRFIAGIPANRAVACWQGRVLAGISVQAIRTQHATDSSTNTATVVHVIDNPEMSKAAMQIVAHLGVSGLWGIDFMLDEASNAAYAINVKPCATPICHLPLGKDRNLLAALFAQLTDAPPLALPTTIKNDHIALFPGEWRRDASSRHLDSAYHDIPRDEAQLIQECVATPWAERGWIARVWSFLRPHRPRQITRDSGNSHAVRDDSVQ